ncbi:MAG: spore germination protein [Merismopedia sp. SIO2A8]|nr:spore germination protein [Merismopedia sp. SIO2A8]
MQDHQRLSGLTQFPRFPAGWVLAILSMFIIVGGGSTGWWAWNRLSSPTQETTEETTQTDSNRTSSSQSSSQSQPQAAAPIAITEATIYMLGVADTSFELIPITLEVESSEQSADVLDAAFVQLLAGNIESSAFSEIPGSTTLLDLTVEDDGIHVDLSSEFEQGGGSASMMGRLGQVVYTATSLDPAESVWLSVEGTPLELLGGEGLEVPHPINRDTFHEYFPL